MTQYYGSPSSMFAPSSMRHITQESPESYAHKGKVAAGDAVSVPDEAKHHNLMSMAYHALSTAGKLHQEGNPEVAEVHTNMADHFHKQAQDNHDHLKGYGGLPEHVNARRQSAIHDLGSHVFEMHKPYKSHQLKVKYAAEAAARENGTVSKADAAPVTDFSRMVLALHRSR